MLGRRMCFVKQTYISSQNSKSAQNISDAIISINLVLHPYVKPSKQLYMLTNKPYKGTKSRYN